jgi:peroxiredoxin
MTDTNKTVQPLLEPGQIIPSFSLPDADGMTYSPWNYKQRQHLVLLFMRSSSSSETRGLLRAFARQYPAFREEDCSILAITPDPVIDNLRVQEELHLPFPLLGNPKGDVIARYTQWDSATRTLYPSIVLVDRYNALYQQWTAEQEADLPSIEELLASLRYLNSLCTP